MPQILFDNPIIETTSITMRTINVVSCFRDNFRFEPFVKMGYMQQFIVFVAPSIGTFDPVKMSLSATLL
jgi:hypothetical protein